MAVNTNADAACAKTLRVMADQTRFAVVRLLMQRAQHVHELNETLGLDLTLLSHHLRILRDAGIVEASRDGKARLYRLASEVRVKSRGKTLNFGCCTMTLTNAEHGQAKPAKSSRGVSP
jgi:DNA-binding transcriptional ArsR family regulator